MKIGVNLLDLYPGKIGGMEQYVRNLILYSCSNNDIIFYLFLNQENYHSFVEHPNKICKVRIDPKNREIQLYSHIEKLNLDIWFCPLLHLDPKYVMIPSVVTIPDMQHELYPEFFSQEILEWRSKNYEFSVKNADRILTLSNYSKEMIINRFNVSPKKVDAIYLDADASFQSNTLKNSEIIVKKYGLPDEYIFYPANFWKHKNHIKLIQALVIIHKKFRRKIHLVLTGQKKKLDHEIIRLIKKERLSRYIHILGYIDQSDIQAVYERSNLVIFPSLFEGFGIPLVEAMICNRPIVCSDRTSIPEVVGDAAEFINPENADDIAEKILLVLDNPEIQKDLVEKGKIQSKKFSWKITSDKTLNVFKEILMKREETQSFPLVSVITPSYNQGKFIKETIESVLSQDYPNVEYIVIDGGSTDETVQILQSYGSQITWISEKDEGQADAVNKGLKIAKGEIIGWLNSDDTYAPNAITHAVHALQKFPESAVVYGESSYISEHGEFIERYPTEVFNYQRLSEWCFICQPSAFIRRDVLMEVGGLNKNLQLCMDYDLWMRIGKKYDFMYLPFMMANSRIYDQNKTLSRKGEVHQEIISTLYKNYGYVPINWIYGLMDYHMKGKHSIWFYIMVFWNFLYLHRKNPYFLFMHVYSNMKHQLKSFI